MSFCDLNRIGWDDIIIVMAFPEFHGMPRYPLVQLISEFLTHN